MFGPTNDTSPSVDSADATFRNPYFIAFYVIILSMAMGGICLVAYRFFKAASQSPAALAEARDSDVPSEEKTSFAINFRYCPRI